MKTKSLGQAGLIKSEVPGRTDAHPVDARPGSFVFPADVVSAMGDGNTLAGAKVLRSILRAPKPSRGLLPRGRGVKVPQYADGGEVPIAAAGGEYIASPEEMSYLGDGDLDRGVSIGRMLVERVRNQNIRRLSSLPPPK